MTPDAPAPVDTAPAVASLPKKRCLRFCLYNAFLSFIFLILGVVLIPRWFPFVGNWLFPYVKTQQMEKWQPQLSSLTAALKDLKPQELEALNQRLHSLEEKMQKASGDLSTEKVISERLQSFEEKLQSIQPALEASKEKLTPERLYYMDVILLCQDIEGRLIAEQDYQVPFALLAERLHTPEEKAWLQLLSHEAAPTVKPQVSTEGIANWPWWLKPVQNFFTIQPLESAPSAQTDKRMALQKLKDVVIANYQKASLAVARQESAS